MRHFLLPLVALAGAHTSSGLLQVPFSYPNLTQNLSFNVSSCPGYTLTATEETFNTLTAKLILGGPACNAFGTDIVNLTVVVTYESKERLHVKIFDDAERQFTIPESVIHLPVFESSGAPIRATSDLVFNYESDPFGFWISRRSAPDSVPLFDTRITSLPKGPIPPIKHEDNRTALDAFPLIFEDQYLQVASALPVNTNIYGLGEVVASSGFRRNTNLTIQTMWARGVADPLDENVYGSHPFYMEHRYEETSAEALSHGVFLLNAAGSDILLSTPPGSPTSLIEYRLLGGILDFYFFSGPTPQEVVQQYGELIGFPAWQPVWAFGFHLCRWGYHDLNETRLQVEKMREANIPLEVMWNDIDLYHAVRDFTTDPVRFPQADMKQFIEELVSRNQKYIPILDAAIPKQSNSSDIYDPYLKGAESNVFITNPDGSEYIGQVWPGYTVFPDWFALNTTKWWGEALTNWSHNLPFHGIWLDMNEASSFCDGSCGTGANLSDTSLPFILPGEPGNLVTAYPECYDPAVSGPSGNLTVNGTLTCRDYNISVVIMQGIGVGGKTGLDVNTPPYPIHNGYGRLSIHGIATNATHANGAAELDVHNLWGLQEAKATFSAVRDILGKRPFLISRSTFPSAGKWTGHWLGDNFSKWQYMYLSIQGILQFQLFQIPFVGADTCGFYGNSDEELCARWMSLSAFTPFYRNHNSRGSIGQEPWRWDAVARSSRKAISIRYALLPYWYTLFANASMSGLSPVRPLFFEFPTEPELFGVDRQFLIGRDILVTPVLTPNVTSVQGIFPGRGRVTWRDWYTHEVVKTSNGSALLSAPLDHINVHIREGSILLLHSNPGYTIAETQAGPYSLLVVLTSEGHATGSAFVDDGESLPPTPHKILWFKANKKELFIHVEGSYEITQRIETITVLGVGYQPYLVEINGSKPKMFAFNSEKQELMVQGLSLNINQDIVINWE